MTINAFKDTVRAQPFRAFAVHLPGRSIDVTHPEQVAFPNDNVSAIILTPDGHIYILDVGQISGIEKRARRAKGATGNK